MQSTRPARSSLSSVLRLLFVLAGAYATMGTACLGKECRDSTYCIRKCECTDEQNDSISDCEIQYRCDLDTEMCESAYGEESCEDVCKKYAAEDVCGSKRCDNENHCRRDEECVVTDAETGEVVNEFDCEKEFKCETEVGVCEEGYNQSDIELCNVCAEEQNGVGVQ